MYDEDEIIEIRKDNRLEERLDKFRRWQRHATDLDLSPGQAEAVDRALAWHRSGGAQVHRIFGYAGTGKALAHGSMVQSPAGPTKVENLSVGDQVFGADGRPVSVTGVFPQGVRDAYRVTFRDGASVLCDGDHLWAVRTARMRQLGRPYKTMKTVDILAAGIRFDSGGYRFSIPLCGPLQYPIADLPIDPYVLGVLIGDGTALGRSPTLCSWEQDAPMAEEMVRRLPAWVRVRINRNGSVVRYGISAPRGRGNEYAQALRALGLDVRSPERFIPDKYLRGSVEQRLDLLRGLMDADGTARRNRISFSTKSRRLAADLSALVQSLGGTAIMQGTGRSDEYQVNVKLLACPFLLPRKAAEWRPSTKNPPSRHIVSIEPEGATDHTCISVDAPDGLFLTDHHVVTHNTTLARTIARRVRGDVMFAAYTGKAAHVLRSKGLPDAQTIHSLIYVPVERDPGEGRELERRLAAAAEDGDGILVTALRRQLAEWRAAAGKPRFELDEMSDLRGADLLIVDEVSMVGRELADDLLSFGVPVLVLGDPEQLPPVGGAGALVDAEPDSMLTEIHRQAEGNPIVATATRIRSTGMFPPEVKCARLDLAQLPHGAQVIVGKNATRWSLIAELRAMRRRPPEQPTVGDKIVILKNNRELGVFNGQQFYVIGEPCRAGAVLHLNVMDDTTPARRRLTVMASGFVGTDGEAEAGRYAHRGEAAAATFAEVITCHKSQGSEWSQVAVIDEGGIFGRDDPRTPGRWRYTAATRASSHLVVADGWQ